MRRIRSESWTFIWQPKVRIQAVLASPDGTSPDETGDPRASLPPGFLEIQTWVVGVWALWAASLIIFLRLVDGGLHRDLSGTALEPELPDLKVASPRRPPKYIYHGALFLLAEREHRALPRNPTRPPRLPLPHHLTTGGREDDADRFHLPAPDSLHRPQRNLKAEASRPLPQRGRRVVELYYAVI